VPPGCFPFFEALCESGYIERGGRIITTYFEENLAAALPAAHIEGLYACMDYYQSVGDRFSRELLDRYNARFRDGPHFTGGSGCTGMYRGVKLWEAAVTEAGSLDQAAVVAALDHASILEGPGGPAEMLPGQHHVRMNMYIAQVHNSTLEVVESLGSVDPKEHLQAVA
jgi:branched-chain amino acid transport system substrate-binding protein